jgi:hypothetical protein
MGGVVILPAACLASQAHFGAAAMGGSLRRKGEQDTPLRRGELRTQNPGVPWRASNASALGLQEGVFAVAARSRPVASLRRGTESRLRPGPGEARGMLSTFAWATSRGHSGSAERRGSPPSDDGGSAPALGRGLGTGDAVERSEPHR